MAAAYRNVPARVLTAEATLTQDMNAFVCKHTQKRKTDKVNEYKGTRPSNRCSGRDIWHYPEDPPKPASCDR